MTILFMKNRVLSSAVYIVLGILLVLTPTVLLPTCNSESMKMACYYTGRAEIGLGILIIILGGILFVFSKEEIREGISIAQIGIGVLILLYPTKIIGLCGMSDMDCRVQTFPALIVISVILIVVSVVNILYITRKKQKTGENHE